jgi:GNAT superfamily N-acetyltransferase
VNFEIKITEDVGLDSDQKEEIDALLMEAFADDGDPGYEWAQPTLHVAAHVDGLLASHVGVLTREITVGRERIRVAGVSDVGTRADFRRQGLAKKLMLAAEAHLRQAGEHEFAFLFCNPELVKYYAGCGYLRVEAPLFIESRGERFAIDEIKMVLSLGSREWPEGEIDLLGLPW